MEIDLNFFATIIGTIFLFATWGIMLVLAFLIGARTAQKANRGEEIKMAIPTPTQIYKEHRENVEASKEQERLNTMLENINNYDGTGFGQKDVL